MDSGAQLTLSSVMTIISILVGCITTLIAWNIKTTLKNYDENLKRVENTSTKNIDRVERTSARAHKRLDEHIIDNSKEFTGIRRDYVSEPNCASKMRNAA